MENKPSPKDKSGLLTPANAAAYLSISKSTLYRLTDQRKIRFYKIGGSLKFRRNDLEQFIESCRIEPIK